MNWKVRHQGSPQPVELTLDQLKDQLADGRWESTDEVMGPGDADWMALENHPVLGELAAELEPPPPKTYDDETHLDMNALIDVCLVLLVFFILTTTVAALQKRIEAPSVEEGKVKVPVLTKDEVAEQMIHVKAMMEDGQPVIRVEEEIVEPHRLIIALKKWVKQKRRSDLLLEHDDNVPHEIVVKIIDSAKAAEMTRVRLVVP